MPKFRGRKQSPADTLAQLDALTAALLADTDTKIRKAN